MLIEITDTMADLMLARLEGKISGAEFLSRYLVEQEKQLDVPEADPPEGAP